MKKLVSIITLIMTMIVLSVSAYAYSNEFYSIDVGEGFKEESMNETLILNSTEKDGSINIVMNKTIDGKDYFTEDEIERQKPAVKESEFAVDKAEIQTITPNNYRCIYYESHAKHGEKNVYFRQYLIYSGKYCYAITVTTYKTETADTEKYKNVVDSFKVNDYTGKYGLKDEEKPQENGVGSHVSPGLIGGIVGGVLGGFGAFCILKAKQKKK
jgi:hypothetical protein